MNNVQWIDWYNKEINKDYFKNILEYNEYLDRHECLSPLREFWFNAFEVKDMQKVHTVITSSYPYFDSYAADGLAFSSIDEADDNMLKLYRTIWSDLGITYDQSDNSKERWKEQGVLLMPMQLTCMNGALHSEESSWLPFTKEVLRLLLEDKQKRAFILLDKYTKYMPDLFARRDKYNQLIYNYDIEDYHFKDKRIFKDVNKFIYDYYDIEMDWS